MLLSDDEIYCSYIVTRSEKDGTENVVFECNNTVYKSYKTCKFHSLKEDNAWAGGYRGSDISGKCSC